MDHQIAVLEEKQVAAIWSIKRCIWLYLWLLMFEGAIRKWVVPFLADPILIVRDPVVIWIYIQAYRAGLFPRNLFLKISNLLALLSFVAGMIAIQGSWITLLIPIYGFRTDFLHLPMIFIMQKFLDRNDVRKIGKWTLTLAVPMTILMWVQFKSPGGSWINSGSDESFKQIGTSGDHIRAPGTFSFITGPIYFYGIAAAFLLEGLFQRRIYPKWLIISAAFAVCLAPFISGSRTMIGSVSLVVVGAILVGTILQPRLLLRTIQGICVGSLVVLVLMQLPVFQEGVGVLNERFSSSDGGVQQGFFMRFLSSAYITRDMWYDPPLLGYGLGLGTNVGSVLNSGTRKFVLAEQEWDRVIKESGPVLGIAFIFFRLSILIWLFYHAIGSARRGNILPFLIAMACGTVLANGSWGQATTLGFAIFGTGLCLSAMNENGLSRQNGNVEVQVGQDFA